MKITKTGHYLMIALKHEQQKIRIKDVGRYIKYMKKLKNDIDLCSLDGNVE
jgi:hypothetical protein